MALSGVRTVLETVGPNTTALPKKALESTQDPPLGHLSDGACLFIIGSFWPWEVHVILKFFFTWSQSSVGKSNCC